MSGSPMVIMWSNSDGNITLSQRSAGGEYQPVVDNSPPRVATLSADLSSVCFVLHVTEVTYINGVLPIRHPETLNTRSPLMCVFSVSVCLLSVRL